MYVRGGRGRRGRRVCVSCPFTGHLRNGLEPTRQTEEPCVTTQPDGEGPRTRWSTAVYDYVHPFKKLVPCVPCARALRRCPSYCIIATIGGRGRAAGPTRQTHATTGTRAALGAGAASGRTTGRRHHRAERVLTGPAGAGARARLPLRTDAGSGACGLGAHRMGVGRCPSAGVRLIALYQRPGGVCVLVVKKLVPSFS